MFELASGYMIRLKKSCSVPSGSSTTMLPMVWVNGATATVSTSVAGLDQVLPWSWVTEISAGPVKLSRVCSRSHTW